MLVRKILLVFVILIFIGIIECRSNAALIKKSCLSNKKTVVSHPSDYKIKKYQKELFKIKDKIILNFYAKDFVRGNAVYLEVLPVKETIIDDLKCSFNGKNIYLNKKKWGYSGLFAINPENRKKNAVFIINCKADSLIESRKYILKLKKKNFAVSRKALNLGEYSNTKHYLKPGVLDFIKACSEKKRKVLSQLSDNLLNSVFAHPRDMHHINSPFWKRRIYMRYKIKNNKKIKLKSRIKIHRGLDFKGKKGAPIYAMAAGKAVIASKMYYEGNFIILDHGNRIFSYYMHCDKLLIEEGQIIKAGTKIAEVGSTGASTGPHLHVSFVINKEHVNPLSILGLPVRD